ncbi:hypothetical protein M9458_017192, partial [Cirrhinus mrigala]
MSSHLVKTKGEIKQQQAVRASLPTLHYGWGHAQSVTRNQLLRELIARIASSSCCARFAPGGLYFSSRLCGGCGRGVRKWIWWSPFLLPHPPDLALAPGWKHALRFSPRGECSTLHISSSEELDVEDYEELVEVVTRAVAKLKLDWPAEKPTEPPRSKLDERFLRSKPPPPRRGLPFFPDLHTEVSRSSATLHYSNVVGAVEHGYGMMPRVDAHEPSPRLCPLSRCGPRRRWWAEGTRQRQADLLKELDEGEKIKAEDVTELRRATPAAAGREQAHTSTSSSYRAAHKESVATRTPPQREQGSRQRFKAKPSALKTDLRALLQAKKASAKKADPSGEERLTPHHTVPEIVLPTLPPMVLQGAAVPGELISQHPPGNAAVLGSLRPLRSYPLQGTDLATLVTPEVGLERLIPLVDYLAAWKRLPNVS